MAVSVESGLELVALVAVFISVILYVGGWRRSRRAGSGPITNSRMLAFVGATMVLVGGLMVSLGGRAGTSLAIHMLQHELFYFAPLLYVVARTGTALLLGVEPTARGSVTRVIRRMSAVVSWTGRRDVATGVLLAVFTVWHIPALFDTAAVSPLLHGLEHVCFFAAGLVFWSAILQRRAVGTGRSAASLMSLFVVMLVGTAAGALITFANSPIYPVHATFAEGAGIDWLDDQRLAGLVMWVPPTIVLLGVAAWLAVSWLSSGEEGSLRSSEVSS